MLCTLPRSPGVMDLHKYAVLQAQTSSLSLLSSSFQPNPPATSCAPTSYCSSNVSDPAYITLLVLETALEKHIHYRTALLSLQPCLQEILALLEELFYAKVPSRIVSDPLRICHQCIGSLSSLATEAADTSPSSPVARLSAVRHALRTFPSASQSAPLQEALTALYPTLSELNDKHAELITGPIAQLARLRVELRQLRSLADPRYQPANQTPSNIRVTAPAMDKLTRAGAAGRIERWESRFGGAWMAVGGTA